MADVERRCKAVLSIDLDHDTRVARCVLPADHWPQTWHYGTDIHGKEWQW